MFIHGLYPGATIIHVLKAHHRQTNSDEYCMSAQLFEEKKNHACKGIDNL